MKLSACVTAMAMALGVTHAWTFNASNVTSPEEIVDKHQSLQRIWTITSFAQLQQLYLAIPGPVFVELDPSLLPPTKAEASTSEDPATGALEVPGVVPGTTPGVVPGVIPGSEPGVVPGTVPPASKDPASEDPATKVPGVVPGTTPGVVPGVIPGSEPGVVPGTVPPASKDPASEDPATKVPGVVAGTTPGVVPGVIPGSEPGVVPGTVPPAPKDPASEDPATKVPGVVAGTTPGVVPGVIPGSEPGAVPGTVPPASKDPALEDPATKVPGVVAGTTPGVVPGVIPGSEPGVVPGTVPLAPEDPASEDPATKISGVVAGTTPGVVPGVIPGSEPGVVPGAVSQELLSGLGNRLNDNTVAAGAIEISTMMLRKHHRHHEEEDKEQSQGEETIVAKIVITGDSLDLLNMIEAVPLHPRRNDGLKVHLKNEKTNAEGYVMTQIYLFEKNLLRRVTTAFSGDVVLNDDVVTLDDAEADIKFACVGDGNLYLKSGSNATLNSLEIEVTGDGLVQLEVPSVNLDAILDVEVAGSGSVALVTDALLADEIKSTLSGSGNVVMDTQNLTAQKLEASVYGSGVASIATAGSVDKESLNLSGSGQLLAGSIVAATSNVDVWGKGEVLVQVTDKLTVSTSVWGKVGYVNAPPTDVKIKGWWFWRDANTIVYPAAVNKVAIYEPVAVPAKLPAYYTVETSKSALSDDPDYAFVSAKQSNVTELMTTSLSNVQQTDATSTTSHGLFYAFIGVGIVAVNVVAARSWAERRDRGHYTRLL
ncbi:unnamed protein product [Peronospora farinosa]|uniref:Putative auto-transporter adhesin head GIN domain-containing protein n=1 Tax=Peronospora farinosa TaxID=134698 RepID=A0ABN8BUZ1_9STRA|nr:unnamed protein product [Peronospora farinosa]